MVFVKSRESLTQSFEIILKIDQNKAFLCYLQRDFSKISQKFPTQLGFSSKAKNFPQGLLIFLNNRLK